MKQLHHPISRSVLVSLCIASIGALTIAYGVITQGTNLFNADVEPKYHLNYPVVNLADPSIDLPKSTPIDAQKKTKTLVLAGGCFWGVEGVFEKLKGVSTVVSGYSGGLSKTANYYAVTTGMTGHAESVQITYDPEQISYGQLLKIFFAIAHDPTQRDRQGNDVGTQYRSAIFVANDDEKRVAQAYIDQLNQSQVFANPIVTQVNVLDRFYPAESHHQDFMKQNPQYPYVVVHDLPKIDRLTQQFPQWIKSQG
jgi:peptide-methionine (S)-S-oxide reductase